jgi:hypothetical protein
MTVLTASIIALPYMTSLVAHLLLTIHIYRDKYALNIALGVQSSSKWTRRLYSIYGLVSGLSWEHYGQSLWCVQYKHHEESRRIPMVSGLSILWTATPKCTTLLGSTMIHVIELMQNHEQVLPKSWTSDGGARDCPIWPFAGTYRDSELICTRVHDGYAHEALDMGLSWPEGFVIVMIIASRTSRFRIPFYRRPWVLVCRCVLTLLYALAIATLVSDLLIEACIWPHM